MITDKSFIMSLTVGLTLPDTIRKVDAYNKLGLNISNTVETYKIKGVGAFLEEQGIIPSGTGYIFDMLKRGLSIKDAVMLYAIKTGKDVDTEIASLQSNGFVEYLGRSSSGSDETGDSGGGSSSPSTGEDQPDTDTSGTGGTGTSTSWSDTSGTGSSSSPSSQTGFFGMVNVQIASFPSGSDIATATLPSEFDIDSGVPNPVLSFTFTKLGDSTDYSGCVELNLVSTWLDAKNNNEIDPHNGNVSYKSLLQIMEKALTTGTVYMGTSTPDSTKQTTDSPTQYLDYSYDKNAYMTFTLNCGERTSASTVEWSWANAWNANNYDLSSVLNIIATSTPGSVQ